MGCNWSKRSSAANQPVAVAYEELDEEHEGSRKRPSTLSFIAEVESEGGHSSTCDHENRFVPSFPRRAVHSAPPPPRCGSGFLGVTQRIKMGSCKLEP